MPIGASLVEKRLLCTTQFYVHDFRGIISVVVDLDAGLGLEFFKRIRADVVRPVIDVDHIPGA